MHSIQKRHFTHPIPFSLRKMKIVYRIEDVRVVNILLNRGRINPRTRFLY